MSLSKNFILSFLISFIAFNLILETETFNNVIYQINRINYFYISLDWNLKNYVLLKKITPSSIVFIGSSRTAYSVSPQVDKKNRIINLGLIGASISEMDIIAESIVQSKVNADTYFIEINPMSLTKRHMDAMSKLNKGNTITPNSNFYSHFNYYKYSIPIFRYQTILQNMFQNLLQPNSTILNDYAITRKNYHFNEFLTVKSRDFDGHIPGDNLAKDGHKIRFSQECKSLIRWNLGDSKENFELGVNKLAGIIKKLSPLSRKIVLWVPPQIYNYNYGFDSFDETLLYKKIELRTGLKVLNLNHLFHFSDKDFTDCIHSTRLTSQITTQTLLKN